MKIVEVTSPQLIKDFLTLPIGLYKNEPNWIRPLDSDIEDVFDKDKNKSFRQGECTRWVLYNNNKAIGCIAAFYDKKTMNKDNDQPTGGIGFFECINNQEAANLLFDTAKSWLITKGLQAMDGPINFGERDKWWGLLVDGFTEPNYCMHYHLAYYQQLFENYGFKDYFKQYTYHRKVDGALPQIYEDKAARIARDPLYRFEYIRKNNLAKYAEDFRYVYNKAWAKHAGVRDMPKAQAMSIINQLKPILDEEIVWFAYYNEEPIAFFIMIPELNQIVKYLDGKLKGKWDIVAKLKFLYYQKTGKCKKMFGVAFGVIPEFQGKGLEGAIVMAAAKVVQPAQKYTDFEMNWIGDFNPKMMHVAESAGGKICKTHITYRYLFDQSAEFKRARMIE